MPELTPNLWFDTQAKEAADFYCGIFPNSCINNISYYSESGPGETGTVLTVDFELDGKRFTAINGGPEYKFTPAVSFLIDCKDQPEIDHYWDALLAGGGEPNQCGWLSDKYGLSWQVVPRRLGELLGCHDPQVVERVTKAFLSMTKFNVAELEQAAVGACDRPRAAARRTASGARPGRTGGRYGPTWNATVRRCDVVAIRRGWSADR